MSATIAGSSRDAFYQDPPGIAPALRVRHDTCGTYFAVVAYPPASDAAYGELYDRLVINCPGCGERFKSFEYDKRLFELVGYPVKLPSEGGGPGGSYRPSRPSVPFRIVFGPVRDQERRR